MSLETPYDGLQATSTEIPRKPLNESNEVLLAGALGDLSPQSVFRVPLEALSDVDVAVLNGACDAVNSDMKWFSVFETHQTPEEVRALVGSLGTLASAAPEAKKSIAKQIAIELAK